MRFGKYVVREGGLVDRLLPFVGMALIIVVMGLGNHFIDGLY